MYGYSFDVLNFHCIWVGVPEDYCMCCFPLDEDGL